MIKQPIFLLLGWIGLLVAAYFAITTMLFLQRAESIIGSVTQISSYQSRCGGGRRRRSYPCTKYQASVKYWPTNHNAVTVQIGAGSCRNSSSSCGGSYQVGQNVPILYDPQKPKRFRVNTFMGKWGTTVGAAFVTFIMMVCSLFEPSKRRSRWGLSGNNFGFDL